MQMMGLEREVEASIYQFICECLRLITPKSGRLTYVSSSSYKDIDVGKKAVVNVLGPFLKFVAVDSVESCSCGFTFSFSASTGTGTVPLGLIPALRDIRVAESECGCRAKGYGGT